MRRQLTPTKVVIAGIIAVLAIGFGVMFVISGSISGHFPQTKPVSSAPDQRTNLQSDSVVSINLKPAETIADPRVAGATSSYPNTTQRIPTPSSDHHDQPLVKYDGSDYTRNGQDGTSSSSFKNLLVKTKDSLSRLF